MLRSLYNALDLCDTFDLVWNIFFLSPSFPSFLGIFFTLLSFSLVGTYSDICRLPFGEVCGNFFSDYFLHICCLSCAPSLFAAQRLHFKRTMVEGLPMTPSSALSPATPQRRWGCRPVSGCPQASVSAEASAVAARRRPWCRTGRPPCMAGQRSR